MELAGQSVGMWPFASAYWEGIRGLYCHGCGDGSLLLYYYLRAALHLSRDVLTALMLVLKGAQLSLGSARAAYQGSDQ